MSEKKETGKFVKVPVDFANAFMPMVLYLKRLMQVVPKTKSTETGVAKECNGTGCGTCEDQCLDCLTYSG